MTFRMTAPLSRIDHIQPSRSLIESSQGMEYPVSEVPAGLRVQAPRTGQGSGRIVASDRELRGHIRSRRLSACRLQHPTQRNLQPQGDFIFGGFRLLAGPGSLADGVWIRVISPALPRHSGRTSRGHPIRCGGAWYVAGFGTVGTVS